MSYARALLLDAREKSAMRLVETFFAAFTEGRLDAARRMCGPDFSWFGRAIDAAGWTTSRARAFHREARMSFGKLRSIPNALVDVLKASFDPEQLFEGSVGPEDLIALVDVTVAGRVVTAGAVVADIDGALRIARVFDPAALRTGLERLGNSIF